MSTVPKIRKLDDVVINRIAAGEVIQRPSNALKEMIENSLDAGSSMITVTVKQGGLKMMQIQDNGSGIRKEDLEIVCERFTTSKLTKFEDLLNIHTYGFRGEALASISHVAHLSIVTKTADSAVGFKAFYEDGKLKGTIKPCAALQGTTLRVDDLFYNITTRRKALKNYNEEYVKILQVVGRYAVHNSSVGFCLKKECDNNTDIKTVVNSTTAENIRTVFGSALAKELLEIQGNDETLQLKINGFITNPNYSDKKFQFLLFINHRLVDSTALKKTIDQIYANYLPKSNHPFAYLSIELNPANVDVNVHPTKHEVHFLHEEAIVDKVRTLIESRLSGANSSRIMYTQAKMPMNFTIIEKTLADKRPAETVRVDGTEQKIDKFFKDAVKKDGKSQRDIKLKSVLQLRADIENNAHKGLLDFVKNFVFVGVVNSNQCLLQHETKLFLCETFKLLTELFYQIVLFDFANFGVIHFTTPLPIVDLVTIYLDSGNSGWCEEDGPKSELADGMLTLLKEKSAMLEDYFCIEIVDDALISVPMLLDQYVPNMAFLPDFIVRICTEVDWELEQPCLEGIARELAAFYSHLAVEDDEIDNVADSKWKWHVEHVLLPGMKATLLPPSSFATDGTLLEIAHLPDLYRVFERC